MSGPASPSSCGQRRTNPSRSRMPTPPAARLRTGRTFNLLVSDQLLQEPTVVRLVPGIRLDTSSGAFQRPGRSQSPWSPKVASEVRTAARMTERTRRILVHSRRQPRIDTRSRSGLRNCVTAERIYATAVRARAVDSAHAVMLASARRSIATGPLVCGVSPAVACRLRSTL